MDAFRSMHAPWLAVVVALAVIGAFACRRENVGPGDEGDGAGAGIAVGDPVGGLQAAPIAIGGKVVDETTGSAIPGATVIVLRPGVDPERWASGPADSTAGLMAGAAVADSAGDWWVDDLARGRSYTVMVAARGYRPAVFENGLSLLPGDPSPTRIAPVTLRAR